MPRFGLVLSIAILIGLGSFVFIMTMTEHDRQFGAALRDHGAIATATVTRSNPGNHNAICFTYEVDGRSYSGCGSADFDKKAAELSPGDTTHVTYDVRNPAVYCCCHPTQLLADASPLMGLIAAVFMTVVIGSFGYLMLHLDAQGGRTGANHRPGGNP